MKDLIRVYTTIIISLLITLSCLATGWIGQYKGGTGGKYQELSEGWPFLIAPTYDGGFIVSSRTDSWSYDANDALFLKLNQDGNIEWAKTYGLPEWVYERPMAITQMKDGNFAMVVTAGGWDSLLYKLTPTGDIIFQNHYILDFDYPYAGTLISTSDGGLLMAGSPDWPYEVWSLPWIMKLDSSGNIEWSKSYGFDLSTWPPPIYGFITTVIETADGYIAGGEYNSVNNSTKGIYLLHIDKLGNIIYQKVYRNATAYPYYIYPISDGGLLVAGRDDNGPGPFILKLDSSGNPLWSKIFTIPSLYSDPGLTFNFITPDNTGSYIAAGFYSNVNEGGFFYIKIDDYGNITSQKIFNADSNESSITKSYDGSIVFCGADAFGNKDGVAGFGISVVKLNDDLSPSDPCQAALDFTPDINSGYPFLDAAGDAAALDREVTIYPRDMTVTDVTMSMSTLRTFCPSIASVRKLKNPFRLEIIGDNFVQINFNAYETRQIRIDGAAVPETYTKEWYRFIAKKGNALKTMLPKGQNVCITVISPVDPYHVTPCYPFTR